MVCVRVLMRASATIQEQNWAQRIRRALSSFGGVVGLVVVDLVVMGVCRQL